MPIEIKEMHIKIVLDQNGSSGASTVAEESDETDKIVEACVEQVMEILSKKEER